MTPTDTYIGPRIDPVNALHLAEHALACTGQTQRVHAHKAGERCRSGCIVLRPPS